MLGYYVHDLSPFLIRFTEKIGIRWYGLAYVAAFVVGFLLLRSFVRRGYCELRESQVSDFITIGALLGVMVGGRLGYMLFYNWEGFSKNPMIFFHFLEGGMASHGGILGLVAVTYFFARRHKITWRGIGDNLCTVAPLGLCFGRLANFINGELYGRKTDVSWAVQFPEELREADFAAANGQSKIELERELAPFELPFVTTTDDGKVIDHNPDSVIIDAARDNGAVQDVLREYLNARHPSQLYQALMEGLALFLILFLLRARFPQLKHGILTGVFFIGYAVFRILGEQFREPSDGFVGAFTRGQFLSLFMIAIGVGFVLSAKFWPYQQKLVKRKRIEPDADDPPPEPA